MKVEIIPGIWIGSTSSLKDTLFLNDKNINNIIDLEKDLDFLGNYLNYNELMQNNLQKYEILKLVEYLNKVTDTIYEKVSSSENILISCNEITQKSCIIVLIYFIKFAKLPKDISINIIRTKIPFAFKPINKYEFILNYF